MREAKSTSKKFVFIIAVFFFLIGLGTRLVVLKGPHIEGDELIYMALVEQLDSGQGYTLQGHPLLYSGRIDLKQYNHKLFYHPPGGVGLFWFFYKIFGKWGFPIAQICCYALFFWSIMFLATLIGESLIPPNTGFAILAGLAAFNPIMSHVTTNFWLDGPILAFSTLAVALFIKAVKCNNYSLGLVAGIVLGYASLIKMTSFLVVPGCALLAWMIVKPRKLETLVKFSFYLLIPGIIFQLSWAGWQWAVMGSPFPSLSGKPSKILVESNSYVYYLTVIRSPWLYVTLIPRILWTLVPGIVLWFLVWDNKNVRWIGLSLITWLSFVLFIHIILGFMGYSIVMRYVILIVPAAAILFAMTAGEAISKLRHGGMSSAIKGITVVLLVISAVAFSLEIAEGVRSSLHYNYDLIVPIFGKY